MKYRELIAGAGYWQTEAVMKAIKETHRQQIILATRQKHDA